MDTLRKLLRLLAALTLVLIPLLLSSTPVSAIGNPDSGPTIEYVDIYRHCLETDDMLVLVQYYLDYDTNPDETINQAYLGRLMDGTTELVNCGPYSYYDKGYDHGIFSMYLAASEAAGLWEDPLSVRFDGNPMLEWPGDPPSATTFTLNWHSTTTAKATELLLSSQIISIANSLSDYWSVALTSETAGGPKLSSYGEQYFVNAVPNLRTMIPAVFPGTVETPTYTPEAHTQSYRDTLLNRWSGTNVEHTFNMLAEWTTIPVTIVKGLLWFIPMMFIAYFAAIAVKDLRPALFLILLMLPLGNLIGMLTLTVTIVGALLCIIALGYALFYRPAAG